MTVEKRSSEKPGRKVRKPAPTKGRTIRKPTTSKDQGAGDDRRKPKTDSSKSLPFDKYRKPLKEKRKRSFEDTDEADKRKKRFDTRYKAAAKPAPATTPKSNSGEIRLNKYIANAGVCSRRDADKLIESGVVKVNGKVVSELGSKVQPNDVVSYGDQKLTNETPRYVLLNKPKDYLCTMEDPENRKTVMLLVNNACRERIYPVGRLDRHTTGLLLFTNDGELTKRLMHPSHKFKKLYHVALDKNLTLEDLKKISAGLVLNDGLATVDGISYVSDKKNEVGIEIHIGKNRIVRRIFEHLGYDVTRLDRVMLGPLTKKDLPRGRYRHLTEKEVSFLKML